MLERATRECSDVADDRDVERVERARAAPDRVQVEQALRGVLVAAVAGVHDVGGGRLGVTRAAAPTAAWRMTITSGS